MLDFIHNFLWRKLKPPKVRWTLFKELAWVVESDSEVTCCEMKQFGDRVIVKLRDKWHRVFADGTGHKSSTIEEWWPDPQNLRLAAQQLDCSGEH